MKQKNTKKLRQLARKRLLPLIKHCEKTRGGITDVVARLDKHGLTPAWHEVKNWLHPDEGSWQNPNYATGVALESVQAEMCGGGK